MSGTITRCANCGRLVIRGQLCICTNGGAPTRAVPVAASVLGSGETAENPSEGGM